MIFQTEPTSLFQSISVESKQYFDELSRDYDIEKLYVTLINQHFYKL